MFLFFPPNHGKIFQDILIKFYHRLQQYRNPHILLALSGGPDSLLCFLLLLSLKQQYGYEFSTIVVNHKLDKKNFFQEEMYIKNLCSHYQIPCHIKYLMEELGHYSLNQDFFRQFRREKLITTAYEYGHNIIVTGHNLEDKVDTYLMRIGKGSGIYGACSMDYSCENYGMVFMRPLLDIHRSTIEQLMKNYGYFLDGTRHMNFQRNNIRKFHSTMASLGLNIKNIHKTIEKNQQFIQWITQDLPPVQTGFNWYYVENFFQNNPQVQYHLLRQGVTHINPMASWDIMDMDLLKKKNFTKYSCWFILDDHLFITGQPLPQHQKIHHLVAPNTTYFYQKKFWIKNSTNHVLHVITWDQWIKNQEKLELPWNKIMKKYEKYLSSTPVIATEYFDILDENMMVLHGKKTIKYLNMNKFFLWIE
jgi:tRNA(Ile)-lysidine synthetase-like protein